MSKKEDLQFGLNNEQKVMPILENFLNTKLQKGTNEYSIYDWWNETKTIFVELKSRRITHNKFDTALIGYNKVQQCTNKNINYYFVWLYTDGLYYLKYNKELFDTFDIKEITSKYRYDVNRIEISKVLHIPTKLLQQIPNLSILPKS